MEELLGLIRSLLTCLLSGAMWLVFVWCFLMLGPISSATKGKMYHAENMTNPMQTLKPRGKVCQGIFCFHQYHVKRRFLSHD